jgi:hypothetical protein
MRKHFQHPLPQAPRLHRPQTRGRRLQTHAQHREQIRGELLLLLTGGGRRLRVVNLHRV